MRFLGATWWPKMSPFLVAFVSKTPSQFVWFLLRKLYENGLLVCVFASLFLPRYAIASAANANAVMRCLPVCLSRSWILSKRINIPLQFFFIMVAKTIIVFPHQTSWQYCDGDPLTAASNAGGLQWHKSRFWTNSWLSIHDCCSARSTIDGRRCSSV